QIHKVVWTKNEEGDRIRVVRTHTDQEEGLAVAHNIFETKMNLQLPNSDFAILYRTNAQSRAFEESLRRLNIPYRIYGGMSFYQRKEIKDLLAYFRLVINPDDEEALMRIINYPARGIGKTTLEKLVILSNDNNVSIWKLLENVSSLGSILNSGTKEKISAFLQTMKSFQAMLKKKDAYELAHHIAQTTGILRELRDDKTPEGVSRYENIEELLNAIKDFVENDEVKESPSGQEIPDEKTERTLDFFMQDIALLTDADDKKNNADTDRVSLMTVHAAKGLEFPFVHIVGLEENLFPSAMAIQTRNELEEERRLFYVALTRAKTRAMLSYSLSRYKWGNLQYCEPSRFIEEISPECVELPGAEPARTPKSMQTSWKPSFTAAKPDAPARKPVQPAGKLVKLKTAEKMTAGNSELSGLEPGTVVEHQRFGRGKVISIEGNNESLKATVNFENAGSKQLLLKFAKLTIIG
ncbi:MAG: ATP-binding domain-containing protein, partial [Bacteroidetes bacterium]|nr:ATP-binding domain-containing protein [Bacteroidota bacterium]